MAYFMIWAEQQSDPMPLWSQLMPFFLLFMVAYFLFIRPMNRQEAARRAAVSALKRNDRIVTSGGLIGIVETIKENENEVVLKGGIRVTKTSIVDVVPGGDKDKE